MPNAQVVTEGFPLHALGLNYSLQPSLLPAGIVTYKISVLLTGNPKPVFFFLSYITSKDWGLSYISVSMLTSIFHFSIPSLMVLWMCIPGAFFPFLIQAAVCFIFVDCLPCSFCHHFSDIKVLLFNLMVAKVTLCPRLGKCLFSHLSLSSSILFYWFFICMVKRCRMAEAGLVGRFALSLSLYYALPYWF